MIASFIAGHMFLQECFVRFSGQNVVAIDHQHEFGIEILPVVGVLPAGFVDGNKWIAFGHAEIVRDCALFLALVQDGLAGLLRFPDPQALFRPFARHRCGEFAQDLLVDLRPEFQQRHGGVEADVERAVVGVVETFEQREGWRELWVGACRAAPEGAAVA